MANYSRAWDFKGALVFIGVALGFFLVYRVPVATTETSASFISVAPDAWSKSGGQSVSARLPNGETVSAFAPSDWVAPSAGAAIAVEDKTTLLGVHLYRVKTP